MGHVEKIHRGHDVRALFQCLGEGQICALFSVSCVISAAKTLCVAPRKVQFPLDIQSGLGSSANTLRRPPPQP